MKGTIFSHAFHSFSLSFISHEVSLDCENLIKNLLFALILQYFYQSSSLIDYQSVKMSALSTFIFFKTFKLLITNTPDDVLLSPYAPNSFPSILQLRRENNFQTSEFLVLIPVLYFAFQLIIFCKDCGFPFYIYS